jgi:hypothetical protein
LQFYWKEWRRSKERGCLVFACRAACFEHTNQSVEKMVKYEYAQRPYGKEKLT